MAPPRIIYPVIYSSSGSQFAGSVIQAHFPKEGERGGGRWMDQCRIGRGRGRDRGNTSGALAREKVIDGWHCRRRLSAVQSDGDVAQLCVCEWGSCKPDQLSYDVARTCSYSGLLESSCSPSPSEDVCTDD